ncbi:hypothetical protein P3T35_007558 [Kitasatospora sp. GP30]|uniref:hypothetical protein n=1 Tax=Kitasatospora sp. GP30 TaxID=3035084 RepID=UPI000C6FFE1D|nr:hypothetical protein [Kitasatospora sp. GP30]MDH6145503.1 hypothetical protein [Kitasatospora sp. GP30]
MSDTNSPSSQRRSAPLAGAPVVRRGGQWWLVTGAGSILATNPVFTGELDRFAVAMAAADREVALLRDKQAATRKKRKGKRR